MENPIYAAALPNVGYESKESKSLFENCHSYQCRYNFFPDSTKSIATIHGSSSDLSITISAKPSEDQCKILYDQAKPSMVGKNDKTIMDEKYRSSREFTSDEFTLTQEVLTRLFLDTSQLVSEYPGCRLLSCSPYKMIVYGLNDFFRPHIDSCHDKTHSMTAVVLLNTSFEGGSFYVCEGESPLSPGGLIIFDRGILHEVKQVTKGYRISFTFNLEIDCKVNPSTLLQSYVDTIVKAMKKLGVKRFGYLSKASYENTDFVRGSDAYIHQLFEPYVSNVKEVCIYADDGGDGVQSCYKWYSRLVWDQKCSGPGSSIAVREQYIEDGLTYETRQFRKKPFPDEWEPDTDNWCIYRPKYCLGDVFLLWSDGVHFLSGKANDNVWLGNNGFDNNVYGDVLFVMTLK
jgi:predicted 2-oxoglutarate/Fe(II)-dependent dioxygenase YbiX